MDSKVGVRWCRILVDDFGWTQKLERKEGTDDANFHRRSTIIYSSILSGDPIHSCKVRVGWLIKLFPSSPGISQQPSENNGLLHDALVPPIDRMPLPNRYADDAG